MILILNLSQYRHIQWVEYVDFVQIYELTQSLRGAYWVSTGPEFSYFREYYRYGIGGLWTFSHEKISRGQLLNPVLCFTSAMYSPWYCPLTLGLACTICLALCPCLKLCAWCVLLPAENPSCTPFSRISCTITQPRQPGLAHKAPALWYFQRETIFLIPYIVPLTFATNFSTVGRGLRFDIEGSFLSKQGSSFHSFKGGSAFWLLIGPLVRAITI